MKRIVIDARELRTSSGRYVERLLRYLQDFDQEHQYSVLLKPDDIAGWVPTNANFEKVACSHKEFSFDEQFGLLRQINSLKADLVHFPFPQQPILYHGLTITTIHDLTTLRFNNPDKNPSVFKFKQQVYKRVIKRAARKSARVIVGSQFVKDDVVQFAHIDPTKITVAHLAADPITDPSEALPELENKQFIMYVGRPTPHKNLERLIESFEVLQSIHKDLVLVLAGKKDANYGRIESLVHEKSISNIVFTDFVSEGQLRWLYEHCAAYVFPSLSEGFGLPGLEAMSHKAPVVSSNATCLPEIYGDAALYFNPFDITEMASVIHDVIANQQLRNRLINEGVVQVRKFSWQTTAQTTLDIYNSVLESRS
jgi:glycosyltransferase involved in cell wall biosynthesis